jgi:hypothetical protein
VHTSRVILSKGETSDFGNPVGILVGKKRQSCSLACLFTWEPALLRESENTPMADCSLLEVFKFAHCH